MFIPAPGQKGVTAPTAVTAALAGGETLDQSIKVDFAGG